MHSKSSVQSYKGELDIVSLQIIGGGGHNIFHHDATYPGL